MKLAALVLIACASLAASAGMERDERLDLKLTPEQQEICKAGGGCVTMTMSDLRALVRETCARARGKEV